MVKEKKASGIILIPCLNEAATLEKIIKKIRSLNLGLDILVIDDGSTDNSYQIAEIFQVNVIRNRVNKGLTVVIYQGFNYCLKHNYNYLVIFDGDNQYYVKDIPRLLDCFHSQSADLVLGVRDFNQKHIPFHKKALYYIGGYIFHYLFQMPVLDCTTGFRVFSSKIIKKLEQLDTFTYTYQTLAFCKKAGGKIAKVKVATNCPNRPSRLANNSLVFVFNYISDVVKTTAALVKS